MIYSHIFSQANLTGHMHSKRHGYTHIHDALKTHDHTLLDQLKALRPIDISVYLLLLYTDKEIIRKGHAEIKSIRPTLF
jgi:hypothetical protein